MLLHLAGSSLTKFLFSVVFFTTNVVRQLIFHVLAFEAVPPGLPHFSQAERKNQISSKGSSNLSAPSRAGGSRLFFRGCAESWLRFLGSNSCRETLSGNLICRHWVIHPPEWPLVTSDAFQKKTALWLLSIHFAMGKMFW